MCEISETCPRRSLFWVQSRRDIQYPGNAELGIEPFKSGVNVSACTRHLAMAVRIIVEKNRDAANGVYLPSSDGVIVKQRTQNGAWQ